MDNETCERLLEALERALLKPQKLTYQDYDQECNELSLTTHELYFSPENEQKRRYLSIKYGMRGGDRTS